MKKTSVCVPVCLSNCLPYSSIWQISGTLRDTEIQEVSRNMEVDKEEGLLEHRGK